ncbi:jg17860 [Pararge aegeria aegeria]|uniref:Jg17860 protein n=1 Tax=Pararge aegeria aegeria TaxID=348720 RepID=A0A8S4QN72_9NEOP|nr:jg17860 [Pararge aegeria aegeria]
MSEENMETPRQENIIKRHRDTQHQDLKDEIKDIIKSLKEYMEDKLDSIRQDIKECNSKMLSQIMDRLTIAGKLNNTYGDTIKKLDERITKIEDGQMKTIQRLEEKIEELMRLKRMKSVEIKNIPFKEGEKLDEPIKMLCKVVGLDDIQIRSAYRVTNRKKESSIVIVKFFRCDDRSQSGVQTKCRTPGF